MDCRQLFAQKIKIQTSSISFLIHKVTGEYWGDFYIYAVDRTISHTNNTPIKFRTEINKLDCIRFLETKNKEGLLEIGFIGDLRKLCISTISEEHWAHIIDFVNDWPERDKFIRVKASDVM